MNFSIRQARIDECAAVLDLWKRADATPSVTDSIDEIARAMRDPEGFWGEAAHAIDWYEPAKKVFDPTAGAFYGVHAIPKKSNGTMSRISMESSPPKRRWHNEQHYSAQCHP